MNISISEKRARFAKVIRQPGATLIPGAYDALSATLVEGAGFDAVYIGSFAAGASAFSIADVGLLTLTELTEQAHRIVQATSLPVLTDGEGGFFEPANIWRTVRSFEDAGVVGIHIEDNLGGKHSAAPAGLEPTAHMVQKIRAAVDARTDREFQIIARSDALWVNGDLDECAERLIAYADAGADAVFAPGISAQQLREIRSRIGVPFMVLGDLAVGNGNDSPPSSIRELEEAGANIIVLFYYLLGAAAKGVTRALNELRRNGDLGGVGEFSEPVSHFESRMGYDAFSRRVAEYSEVPHV